MAKYCIIKTTTGECVNILELDDSSQWIDHAGLTLAPRHDGQVGWKLINSEWDYIAPIIDYAGKARRTRNILLRKYIDTMNPIRWDSFSQEKKQQWIQYRQNLLDIPQQSGFPNNIIWPTMPDN